MKKKEKQKKKYNKNDLQVLDSDYDFSKAFQKNDDMQTGDHGKKNIQSPKKVIKDKHGIKVLESLPDNKNITEELTREDFAQLLEQSFTNKTEKPEKKTVSMPLKKRLKRYPPVEAKLDLHGYSAAGAGIKVRSFIQNHKLQGFFTLKIIVGKGVHSQFGPVLPDIVEDIVKEMKKLDLIIWYEWDKKIKSKSGALIIYLKQFDQFE